MDPNVIDLQRWRDFNDAPGQPEDEPFMHLDPEPAQTAIFFNVVFGYLEGFIPLRGFIDKGQGTEGKPHNAWIPADADSAFNAAAFARWAAKDGAAFYVIPGTVRAHGEARAANVAEMQTVMVDLDCGDVNAKLPMILVAEHQDHEPGLGPFLQPASVSRVPAAPLERPAAIGVPLCAAERTCDRQASRNRP
jgi:hypothetical protein